MQQKVCFSAVTFWNTSKNAYISSVLCLYVRALQCAAQSFGMFKSFWQGAVNFSKTRDEFQWPSLSSYLIPSKMPSCCCSRQLPWQQNESQLSRESCVRGAGGFRGLLSLKPMIRHAPAPHEAGWIKHWQAADLGTKCRCCNFPYVSKKAIFLQHWSNERWA